MYDFDKARRLLKKKEFDEVFSQSKKIVTDEFIVLYRENAMGQARLGMALSKKMIAKAHDRNRIKRLVRETFRVQQLPSYDIVFLARKGVAMVPNAFINTRLGYIWQKMCKN